jgi:hypothetical protein
LGNKEKFAATVIISNKSLSSDVCLCLGRKLCKIRFLHNFVRPRPLSAMCVCRTHLTISFSFSVIWFHMLWDMYHVDVARDRILRKFEGPGSYIIFFLRLVLWLQQSFTCLYHFYESQCETRKLLVFIMYMFTHKKTQYNHRPPQFCQVLSV